MATIRLCDWTKKRLAKDAQTHTLILGGNEYEISDEALAQLKARLEGDEAPQASALVRVAPPVAAPVVSVEANQEAPAAPDEAPEPAPAPQPASAIPPIVIPASTRERLPVPTPTQADSVLADSVRFEEGTLRALTPGKARSAAQEKLKTKWEDKFEDSHRPLPERVRGLGERQ